MTTYLGRLWGKSTAARTKISRAYSLGKIPVIIFGSNGQGLPPTVPVLDRSESISIARTVETKDEQAVDQAAEVILEELERNAALEGVKPSVASDALVRRSGPGSRSTAATVPTTQERWGVSRRTPDDPSREDRRLSKGRHRER